MQDGAEVRKPLGGRRDMPTPIGALSTPGLLLDAEINWPLRLGSISGRGTDVVDDENVFDKLSMFEVDWLDNAFDAIGFVAKPDKLSSMPSLLGMLSLLLLKLLHHFASISVILGTS